MGISKSSNINNKYGLRIIFYGETPQEIVQRFTENNEIENKINYHFYKEKNWYMFFRINNRNISSINDIENIITNMMPNENKKIFKKNVIICFVQLLEAINILQNYQRKYLEKNKSDMPYFIFNKDSLNQNNQQLWDLKILFNEVKGEINISAINQNLQLYQTDFLFEDFLKCKIFRNFQNLEEIYQKLEHLKERNAFEISINNNTEKLEITFHINQRPDNEENIIHFNKEELNDLSTSSEEEENKNKPLKSTKKKNKEPKKSQKKKKKIQKSNIKILADDYDCILIVEQNILIHVDIVNLEDERTVMNVLLDAANYYNYVPLNRDENKTCYNGFNIMLVGKSQSGKSFLMNKIAGKNITYSSKKKILRTKDIFMRDIYNGKINLYDTCGASDDSDPKDVYSNLKDKIDLLNKNGEKIDLLLIVIKQGEIPSNTIFQDLIINLINLNSNYLVVVNHTDRVENSFRDEIIETFLYNEYEIDDSNIVEVNILRDITPLFAKIFEKFRKNRITSDDFVVQNLRNISNLSNYVNNNNLILYRGISFDNIFKRQNLEAEKLFTKYIWYIAGTNFIPIANIVLPLILILKAISDLYNIYLGQPLFDLQFFSNLRGIRNLNERYKTLLRNLSYRTGLRIFLEIETKFGQKTAIKIGATFLDIFPLVGEVINGIIGNVIDIPTFLYDFNKAKNEIFQRLRSRPNMIIRRIIQDYNDAINYFGKRANININQNYYIIPGEEIYNNIIGEINDLNINELLIDNDHNNNV